MAQFRIYRSSDPSAPVLSGDTGSLLTVLDAVLVNGYATQSAAGWTKPFPNTASYGCYKQGSGSSGCTLFVLDNGASAALGKEAQLSGWDYITSIEGGIVTGSNPFPTPTQLSFSSSGVVFARKSSAATSATRSWIIAADSMTMYAFVSTIDTAGSYMAFMFGDFFSIKSGSADTGRCMIAGRSSGNSAALAFDKLDALDATLTTAVAGNFAAHPFGGMSSSVALNKHGDGWKGSTTTLIGTVPYLNPVDNSIYLSPIWIAEGTTGTIRGRMRGLYQPCHALSSFTDSQLITGSANAGDFRTQTFMTVKSSSNAGVYVVEISDTLETN